MSSVTSVILSVVFIVVVLVVLFVVYYLLYNKKINDKLKNNESMKHNSMIEVDTVGKSFVSFFGVAIIFIMFFELNGIKTDIEEAIQAESEFLSNKISGLEVEISMLEDKIEKQNSLVNNFECTTGEVNLDDRTVELQFVCILEEYSKDTKLTLVNGDKKIEFAYGDNGKFNATESFSIFDTFEEISVIYKEDKGVFRTSEEEGIFPVNLVNDCLPELGEGISIDASVNDKKVEISGGIIFGDVDAFENIELYVLRNGEKIKDISDLDYTGEQPSFDVKVDAGDDDSILVVLSGTDKYGFTHKKILVEVSSDCTQTVRMDGYASIYDSDGNLLSGVDIK